jgi:hypothetical protein
MHSHMRPELIRRGASIGVSGPHPRSERLRGISRTAISASIYYCTWNALSLPWRPSVGSDLPEPPTQPQACPNCPAISRISRMCQSPKPRTGRHRSSPGVLSRRDPSDAPTTRGDIAGRAGAGSSPSVLQPRPAATFRATGLRLSETLARKPGSANAKAAPATRPSNERPPVHAHRRRCRYSMPDHLSKQCGTHWSCCQANRRRLLREVIRIQHTINDPRAIVPTDAESASKYIEGRTERFPLHRRFAIPRRRPMAGTSDGDSVVRGLSLLFKSRVASRSMPKLGPRHLRLKLDKATQATGTSIFGSSNPTTAVGDSGNVRLSSLRPSRSHARPPLHCE